MAEQMGVVRNVLVKGIVGLVLGGALYGVSWAMGFPLVFRVMFFCYAIVGAVVFMMLDAPPVKPIGGGAAVTFILVFYGVLCGTYIGVASSWPQYDPEDEKGKIEMIVAPKRKLTEQGKAEELIARAKALQEKADTIMQRLQAVGGVPEAGGATGGEAKPAAGAPVSGDLVAQGKQQWELQECYNCHKLFGQGGKKRGPELDNIGNLLKPEELKQKILDPQSWMAEGFEKEYEKKKMPDKYKELMADSEVDALVAFLTTLKDANVNTPKPIKKK
jgi:uncharacterized membrane protein YeaQ/YmgE (transglycosylase-associated protein family)